MTVSPAAGKYHTIFLVRLFNVRAAKYSIYTHYLQDVSRCSLKRKDLRFCVCMHAHACTCILSQLICRYSFPNNVI